MGDGAAWIKAGVDVLGAKCHFVLDKFHLNQAIMMAIRHLGDSASDAREAIYDGKICDLFKYKQEKKQRIIQEEIRKEVNKEIKRKQKIYTDVWNHQTAAGSTRLVDGMYCLTKKLRGII